MKVGIYVCMLMCFTAIYSINAGRYTHSVTHTAHIVYANNKSIINDHIRQTNYSNTDYNDAIIQNNTQVSLLSLSTLAILCTSGWLYWYLKNMPVRSKNAPTKRKTIQPEV